MRHLRFALIVLPLGAPRAADRVERLAASGDDQLVAGRRAIHPQPELGSEAEGFSEFGTLAPALFFFVSATLAGPGYGFSRQQSLAVFLPRRVGAAAEWAGHA